MKLLELITGNDNVTLEPSFFWAALGFCIGMGLEIYCVVTGKIAFSMTDFGAGTGALLALMAGAYKFSK